MDIYVCDVNFNKTAPVDMFGSVIWTDRYNSYGDVTLTVPDNPSNRALITEGQFLQCNLSPTIMLVETIVIKDGVITATGYDLLYFLRNRLFRFTWQETNQNTYTATATAWGIMNFMVQALAASPATNSYLANGQVLTAAQGTNEVIPKLTSSTTAPGGTNPNITVAIPYGNLYDAIKQVADMDNLGFQMVPPNIGDGSGNLLFSSYRGLDRTSSQSTNGQVIFDSAMDTLVEVEELRDISGYRNVAWVWPTGITAQTQIVAVYATGGQASSGWGRRTLMVIADDVTVANYTAANLTATLRQRGLSALANNNYSKMVDGQVVPQAAYTYGTDYALGDIVELRGTLGAASSKARVTEYIHSQDSTGEKAYPTLSVIV